MKQNYKAPAIEVVAMAVEKGIAVSTVGMQQDMINEIWLTEEDVIW